jgi:hypothetical protein
VKHQRRRQFRFPGSERCLGLLACVVAIVWGVVDVFRYPSRGSGSVAQTTMTYWIDGVVPLLDKARMFGAEWVLLGLLLTYAGLKLTWHLAGRRM